MKIDNFKVEDWFNKYEKSAKYDMADTCVEPFTLREFFNIVGDEELHYEYLMNKKLNYGDIQGSERLKTAIKSLYKNININNITVTHGGIGANQLVMLSLIEPDDKVVSILPAYQQHYSIPKSLGADVRYVFLKEHNNWLPELNELRAVTDKNTKLICMTNPNNPTGSVMPDEYLNEIINIARENEAYILCDEVYRGQEHNGIVSKSIADIYEKGISTGSMSKLFSLAGLRLGWIVAPDDVIPEIIKQREYNTISVGIIDDYISAVAIENKNKIMSRNLRKILDGKQILSNWIDREKHISWVEPNGGTTALLRYDIDMPSVELCEKLLNETGVLFLPASTLEMEGYLRVGYCGDLIKLQAGLKKFSEWINNILNFL